jgi:TPP-dependent pyruvate/acetoin dehydrogenase alpha subunit
LEERAVAEQLLDSSVSDARVTVDEAVERARAAPAPQLEDAYAHVFSD